MAETTLILKTLVQGIDKANAQLNSFSKKISDFSDKARAAGAGLTAFGAAGGLMIAKVAGAAAKMESMGVAMSTAFQGNEEAANSAMKTIIKFSKETPYALEEVTSGFLKLKNMGLDPSIEALTSYGNTASAMNKSLNDMVEAVADAATGEFERLKEFGIRAKNQGDTIAFTFRGVTTEVKNSSEEIQQYLLAIGNTEFAGGMAAQSQTLGGLFSSLKDDFFLLSAAIGSIVAGPLKKLMGIFSELSISILEFTQNYPKLTEFIGILALVATGLAAVGGPMLLLIGFLPTIIAGFTALTSVIAAVIGPVALVTAAAAALYVAWQTNFLGIQEITKAVLGFIKEQFTLLKEAVLPELQEIGAVAAETWNKIARDWEAFMLVYGEQVKAGWEIVKNIFLAAFDFIKLHFALLWEGIKLVFDVSWKIFSGVIKTALELLQGDWKGAWDQVKETFFGVWDSIKETAMRVISEISAFIDSLISKITGAINAVKNLVGATGSVNVGASGGSKGVKGKKAAGGPVTAGDPFLVGEQGPEIFTPRIAGNITPNHKLGGTVNINISGVFGSDAGREIAGLIVKELKFASAI